jgi:predicted nucleic acid-binding protein
VKGFVLDASAALAFVFPDERDEQAVAVAQRLRNEPAFVPFLWILEMQNAIVTVERRGSIGSDLATALLAAIASLPVRERRVTTDHVILARRQGLSVYDALYLALALETRLPLTTRDRGLAEAAAGLGVELIAPPP